MSFAVLLYLSLLFISAILLKRYAARIGATPGPKIGRIIDTVQIGPRQKICILEYRGVEALLAVTEHSITLLQPLTKTKEGL